MIARALLRTALVLVAALICVAAVASTSHSETGQSDASSTVAPGVSGDGGGLAKPPPIDVVTVEGPLDPVTLDFLISRVEGAQVDGSQALLIQLNTPGGLAAGGDGLIERVATSRVPVVLWVGPAFARAESAGFAVFEAASLRAVSTGALIGASEPRDLRGRANQAGGDELATLAVMRDPNSPSATARADFARDSARGATTRGDAALAAGLADYPAPTIGDAVVGLDGLTALVTPSAHRVDGRWVAGPVEARIFSTARVVTAADGSVRREPAVDVRFFRMPFTARVLHSVASPSVAYFLLIAALLLMAFEFYTSGVGLVGLAGGGCLALAGFGLAVVGVEWFVVALIVISFGLFASDIQEGVRGPATSIGFAVLVVALGLLRALPPPALRVPVWLLIVLAALVTVAWRLGVAVLVRTRYWSPSIEREDFVGREVEVREPLKPRGTVRMGEGLYAARSHEGELRRGTRGQVVALAGSDLVIAEGTGDERADERGDESADETGEETGENVPESGIDEGS